MNENIRIETKQVWKRKEDGLLVRVTGLIFLEPNRVMWQALPNQGNRSADAVTAETEFKEQYEIPTSKTCRSKSRDLAFTTEIADSRMPWHVGLHSFRGGTI
jgi:hypothetical protein